MTEPRPLTTRSSSPNAPADSFPTTPPPPPKRAPLVTLAELIAAAVFFALAMTLIMSPPSLGMGNNGDFRRLTTNVGLEPLYHSPAESADRRQFVVDYRPARFDHPDYLNRVSQVAIAVPVRVAKAINHAMGDETFSVHFIGFVYLLPLALAFLLWVRASRRRPIVVRVILALAFAFVFLDLGYLVYFNSFYTEAPSLVYLLCAFGCALNLALLEKSDRLAAIVWLLFFCVFVTLFAGARAQNVPPAAVLMLLGVAAAARVGGKIVFTAAVALALVVASAAVYSLRHYEFHLRNQNAVNSVFNGLLLYSPDKEGDLEKLGFPPQWAAYAGRSQFTKDTPFDDPAFRQAFFPKMSAGRMARFYATHPTRLSRPLAVASENLLDSRISYVGNFRMESQIPAKTLWDLRSAADLPSAARWKWPLLKAFSTWTRLKAAFGPRKTWFWLAAGTCGLALAVITQRSANAPATRVNGAALGAAALMLLLIPPVCIAGDGTWEIRKHLLLASVSFDLMLLLMLWTLLPARSLRRTSPSSYSSTRPAL